MATEIHIHHTVVEDLDVLIAYIDSAIAVPIVTGPRHELVDHEQRRWRQRSWRSRDCWCRQRGTRACGSNCESPVSISRCASNEVARRTCSSSIMFHPSARLHIRDPGCITVGNHSTSFHAVV